MSSSLLMTRRFAPLFWTQFFLGVQRQFPQERAGLPDPVQDRRPRRRGADHARGRDLHRALLLSLRARRRIGRPLRQGGGGAAAQACRDRRRAHCRARLLPAFGADRCSFALFLFGVIAALFGPIKYGILPDHLARSELPAGNALVEGATFIAILLGTIVGGIAAKDGGDPAHFALPDDRVLADVLGREPVHPAHRRGGARSRRSDSNILVSTGGLLKFLREDPRLWWGALRDQLVLARRRGRRSR